MFELFYLSKVDADFRREADQLWREYQKAYEIEYGLRRKAEVSTQIVNLLSKQEELTMESSFPYKDVGLQHYFISEIPTHRNEAAQSEAMANIAALKSDAAIEAGYSHYIENQGSYYEYAKALDEFIAAQNEFNSL